MKCDFNLHGTGILSRFDILPTCFSHIFCMFCRLEDKLVPVETTNVSDIRIRRPLIFIRFTKSLKRLLNDQLVAECGNTASCSLMKRFRNPSTFRTRSEKISRILHDSCVEFSRRRIHSVVSESWLHSRICRDLKYRLLSLRQSDRVTSEWFSERSTWLRLRSFSQVRGRLKINEHEKAKKSNFSKNLDPRTHWPLCKLMTMLDI